MIIDQPDGTLTITQTRDCAVLVQYDNRVAGGLDVQTVIDLGAQVTIIKGFGRVPEELRVTDLMTGAEYVLVVEDETTGAICIPYRGMS